MKNKKRLPGENNILKRAMTVLLFILATARLIIALFLPKVIASYDKALMVVILLIVVYLWFRDSKDYRILLGVNKELEKSHEQLKTAEIDAIASLIEAEEEKDEYTRGHSERVRSISVAMAEYMKLGDEARNLIDRASALHDIGKIGISDAILSKKDKLTEEEMKIIKSHPEKADNILEPLKFLTAERDIILSHHERYDGKGYPRGLKGKDIPVEALILAVADSFDAMTSRRSYREPLSKSAVISELKRSMGTQHSPEVVSTLLLLLEKNPKFWESTTSAY